MISDADGVDQKGNNSIGSHEEVKDAISRLNSKLDGFAFDRGMRKLNINVIIPGVLMLVLLCSSCSLGRRIVDYVCEKDDDIARLDVRNGRVILITADVCWEISRSIYCEVKENGRLLVPKTYMGGDNGDDEHQYMVIFAGGDSLVGVLETIGGKRDLVVMHDFKTGESWPRINENEVSYEGQVVKRRLNLFDRLQKEHPSLQKPADLVGVMVPNEQRHLTTP